MRRITDSVINDATATKKSVTAPNAQFASDNTAVSHNKRFNKKRLLQISSLAFTGIGILSLPAKSDPNLDITLGESSAYERVINNNSLTLASVKGDSTYFAIDGFEHGFGYDLTRSYASDLGVELKLKTFDTVAAALNAVKIGEADIALTTASTQLKSQLSLASINLSCGRDAKLTNNGLHPKVSWAFADSNDLLAQKASHYLCDGEQMSHTAKLAKFYNQNLLRDAYNEMHFNKAMQERLPRYRYSFKTFAKKYNHDWELLVAVGYQESHLKPNAVSPTGVQGLMMLTQDTAKEMGISNRRNPSQSINGGARYLEMMKEKFADVPKADRTFFALASYNMGPYAVKKIQTELREQGKDDKSWANVYAYMSDNEHSNSRYTQCMHYVTNIRSYLETIKMQEV